MWEARIPIFLTIVYLLVTLAWGQIQDSLPKRLLATAYFPLRHPQVGQSDWRAAREFTERYMRALGLNVTRQVFRTTVLFDQDIGQLVEGVNLLSVIPGRNWNTVNEDDILLVGAHYDTDVNNLGVRPGSGMVALLEIARKLQEQRRDGLQLKHTVILAAFDLQTSEHTWGKAGDSGVEVFIQSYLNPLLGLRPNNRFRGAIILDSVFNYNSSIGSQVYPNGFPETFPQVERSRRGDFLGVVNRPSSERRLVEALSAGWAASYGAPDAQLTPLSLPQQPPETEALFEYLRQGHAAFWNRATGGVVSSLPAVLLTDTGRYRQVPRRCLSINTFCTPEDVLTPERISFLNRTIDAVTEAVIELQGASGHVTASWVMLLTGTLVTWYVQ